MRDRAYRRWRRAVKGWRRIREDRAQHTGTFRSCPCWGDPDPHVWGRIFSRFADTPKACSCPCCGNPRRYRGARTLPEILARSDLLGRQAFRGPRE